MRSSNRSQTNILVAGMLFIAAGVTAGAAEPSHRGSPSGPWSPHDPGRSVMEGADSGRIAGIPNVNDRIVPGPDNRNTEPIQFELEDPLPDTIPPGVVTPFTIRIVNGWETVVEDSAMLHYRKGSGAFVATPLIPLGENRFSVPLPAAPCGAIFDYYLSAEGDGGSVVNEPPGAPLEAHSVRATIEAGRFVDDFETDTGWTTLPADAVDEVGGWTRVVPIGTRTGPAPQIPAQPDEDHTPDPGQWCFVTGQPYRVGDPEWLTDVDGGPVELISPVITLDAPEATVSYARWFFSSSDNHPDLDDELLVEVSRDAGGNWHEVETVASTGSWVVHSFSLSDIPEATGNQLQIRFSTSDLDVRRSPGNSLTEAAIDDVVVRAVCASSKGDYDGNGAIGTLDFGLLADCLTGPVADSLDDWCATFDFDEDGDVDLNDWSAFQIEFVSAG